MAITTNTNGSYTQDTMKNLARLCKLANVQVEDCKINIKHVRFDSFYPGGYADPNYRYFDEQKAIPMATITLNQHQLEDMVRAYYRYTGIRSRFHKEIQELELMAVMHGVIETDF